MAQVTRILAILLIAVALLLGIYAWTLAHRPPPPAAAPIGQTQPLQPMVVAAGNLPAGLPLTAAQLTIRMQPEHTPGTFADPSLLVGRVPLAAVAQNAPLTDANLASGLADVVAPGERAVAVRVDETNAVGNRVRPGNFVDVFFMLKREGGATGSEVDTTQARLLLSKLRVLSFGDATIAGTETDAAAANSPVRTVGARTAVLAVPTADIDVLTLAEGAGRLVLALRNPSDPEVATPLALKPLLASLKASAAPEGAERAAAGVSLQALAAARATPAAPQAVITAARAPRAPSARNELEVIRGGRTEKVSY